MVWPEPADLFRASWHESCWESIYFSFTSSSPAVFNSYMLFSLSPSLFSRSLSPLLKSLGLLCFSKGQKRAALPKAGCGINIYYHLSSLLCVNTLGVTVLAPHHFTPCCLYIVPSCLHTDMHEGFSKCTHSCLCSHTHIQERAC